MKFTFSIICITLMAVGTVSAQLKNGLYHYRSSFLTSTRWFVIIDDDTAYANWVAVHHWVKCGPVDTLYRQQDGIYSTQNKHMYINNGILYYNPGFKGKKKKSAIRLREAGRSSIDSWNWLYPSIWETGKVEQHRLQAVRKLYEKYAPLVNKKYK